MKDYTDLSRAELTELLRSRGLSVLGVKDALISRLEEYDHTHDPSPSPQLHTSPVTFRPERPVPTPPPHHLIPDHINRPFLLPNEIITSDEGDYANWEKTYGEASKTPDSEAKMISKPQAASRAPFGIRKPETAASIFTEGATIIDKNSSRTGLMDTNSGILPTKRVTKTGFKFKSLAAELYPTETKSTTSPVAENIFTSNTVPKVPANITPTDGSVVSTQILGHLKAFPTSGSATATNIVGLNPQILDIKTARKVESLKTTKSGFKFHSIASLFPEGETSSKPSRSYDPPIKASPQKCSTAFPTFSVGRNSVGNIAATTPPALAPGKFTEAEKLALRAKRFAIPLKDEVPTTTKARREERFGVMETIDGHEGIKVRGRFYKPEKEKEFEGRSEREREREREMEKERERERIRRRVSGGKRGRNDDENDGYYDREYRNLRQRQSRHNMNNGRRGRQT